MLLFRLGLVLARPGVVQGRTIMTKPTAQPDTQLRSDLLSVLAKHGVQGLPQQATAAPTAVGDVSDKAIGAYITSIITGSSAFDASVLNQVTRTLQLGTERAAQEG